MVEQAGQELVEEISGNGGQAAFFRVNVTSAADVDAAVAATVAQFGTIHILVNNAGITRDAQLVKGSVTQRRMSDLLQATL